MPKFKNQNETFSVIFKQCAVEAFLLFSRFLFPKIIEAQLGNFPMFPDLSKDFFDN